MIMCLFNAIAVLTSVKSRSSEISELLVRFKMSDKRNVVTRGGGAKGPAVRMASSSKASSGSYPQLEKMYRA